MKNEPAFPFLFLAGKSNEFFGAHVGLTKREYFAAMAMQGQLATINEANCMGFSPDSVATSSVQYADALIAELSKSEGGEG